MWESRAIDITTLEPCSTYLRFPRLVSAKASAQPVCPIRMLPEARTGRISCESLTFAGEGVGDDAVPKQQRRDAPAAESPLQPCPVQASFCKDIGRRHTIMVRDRSVLGMHEQMRLTFVIECLCGAAMVECITSNNDRSSDIHADVYM